MRLRGMGLLAIAAMVTLSNADTATAQVKDPLAPTGRWSANMRGQAPVPPMGWNSWNAFYSDIDEEKVMASAKIIRDSGLSRRGYRYINIDDGWWLKRRQPDGRMVIRADKFPSARVGPGDVTSFRPLTDRLHAMGFKAGIYSDIGRNSCGQVFTPNFANQPEGSVAEREVGLYGHVDKDIRLYFEEWGFDLIKVDGCGIRGLGADTDHVRKGNYRLFEPLIDMNNLGRTHVPAVRALFSEVSDALQRYNPDGDYLFSICIWGSANVRAWGKDLGNISRTSDDISPHWTRMLTNFDTVATRALYAKPDAWNDADMLFIGSGEFDAAHMTEARSHFSLWAMINSPLIIGFDLRKATPDQIALLGNEKIIALNQDSGGHQAVPVYQSNELQTFAKTLASGDKAVAIFNRGLGATEAILTAAQLKMRDDVEITLTDLWTGQAHRFTKEIKLPVQARQTLVFAVTGGTRSLPDGYYLSERPGDVNPAVDGVVVPQHDPAIFRSVVHWQGSRGSGDFPQYGGWGGAQADRSAFGEPLRVAGKRFDSGLGVLANSRLEVRNGGQSRFSALVGVDDSTAARSAVTFEVYGDGQLLARVGAVRFGQAATPIHADVRGVKLIELVARSTPANGAALPVVWAEAALTNPTNAAVASNHVSSKSAALRHARARPFHTVHIGSTSRARGPRGRSVARWN